MITNLEAAGPPLAGIRKAAILMVIIGDQASAEILKQLEEDEVEEIGREVAKMSSITTEQAESVLEEFYEMTVAHDYVLRGGVDYARKMLISTFGPEAAVKMLDRLMKSLGSEQASFDTLQKADPQQLAKFIHNEHPQTIALILSHLNPSQAAALLVSLPAEIRSDVSLRMANLDQISPEIICQNRRDHRLEVESAGRAEPRIVWRRAGGFRDVQSPGFGHQQGNPGCHRAV